MNSHDDFKEMTLPYLPGKVDPAHVKSNGKLLSDTDIARIEALNQTKAADGDFVRISKKELKTEFSVISHNNQLYAIYKGKDKSLGAGQYAAVKLAQDLKTGEWVALKVQEVAKGQLETAKSEYHRLKQAGIALGESGIIVSDSKKNKEGTAARETYQILMKYVPGITLDSVTDKNMPLTPEQRLQVAMNAISVLRDLNNGGVAHGDAHGGNFLLNMNSLGVKPIDFGGAVDLKGKNPAEVDRILKNETKKAANMLVKFFGFTLDMVNNKIVVVEDKKTNAHQLIPDAAARKVVADIITNLFPPNTQFGNAIDQLAAVKLNYSYFPKQALKVAMVNVNECDLKDKNVLETLKQFDRLVFVDNNKNTDERIYMNMRHELEVAGVSVHDKIYRGNDVNAVINKLPDYLTKEHGFQAGYFQVTGSKASASNNVICIINPAAITNPSDLNKTIAMHMNNLPVSQPDITKISEMINNLVSRFSTKGDDKTRAAAAKAFLQDLNANAGKIDYNQLAKKLDDLEEKMSRKGILKSVFDVVKKPKIGVEVVADIGKQVKASMAVTTDETQDEKKSNNTTRGLRHG